MIYYSNDRLTIRSMMKCDIEKLVYGFAEQGLHSGYGTAQRMYVKRGYVPDGTGVWYDGKQLEPYSKCENNDDLTLYFLKSLKSD